MAPPIMKCTWLTIENTCKTCITRRTQGVQSQAQTRHVMCGSNHNCFGELFEGRDLACDVGNHKVKIKETVISVSPKYP